MKPRYKVMIMILVSLYCLIGMNMEPKAWAKGSYGNESNAAWKKYLRGKGTIDQVTGDHIIIDDQLFRVTPETQYLDLKGEKIGKSSFTKDAFVFFVRNPAEQIVQLQYIDSGEKNVSSIGNKGTKGKLLPNQNRKKKTSALIFEKGVWKN